MTKMYVFTYSDGRIHSFNYTSYCGDYNAKICQLYTDGLPTSFFKRDKDNAWIKIGDKVKL